MEKGLGDRNGIGEGLQLGQRAGSERTVGAGREKPEWGQRRNEIELSENS